MKAIIKARGQGKTTEAIKVCAENNYCLVVHDEREVRRVQQEAERMGLIIQKPMTYYSFDAEAWRGQRLNGFIIDNLDMYFAWRTGDQGVKYVTLSE